MSANTEIEWADHTFNPWSGCSKVSAGCAHCYAAALPPKMRRHALWGPDARRVPATDEYWRQPLAWDRAAAREGVRARVFCASTADVFEDRGDLDPWRIRLWKIIAETPHLDWLLLTKRPRRMAGWAAEHGWPENAWAGVSVENQAAAYQRVEHLLDVPARVRFLSCEPLLGAVDLRVSLEAGYESNGPEGWCSLPSPIHWIIAGGESGRHARPMHPDWVRSLRDQAAANDVPFFFKQWGEWAPEADATAHGAVHPLAFDRSLMGRATPWHHFGLGAMTWRVGKKAAGRLLDGREHLALPGGAS
jgi:protein gp37